MDCFYTGRQARLVLCRDELYRAILAFLPGMIAPNQTAKLVDYRFQSSYFSLFQLTTQLRQPQQLCIQSHLNLTSHSLKGATGSICTNRVRPLCMFFVAFKHLELLKSRHYTSNLNATPKKPQKIQRRMPNLQEATHQG